MALAGLLNCPICITTLNDPRILPCGHSLCGSKSENKCLVQLERKQKRRGEIVCPECQRAHQILAENVPPPYGFRDLLQRTNQLRLCQRHDSELRYFCKDHDEELCDDCWSQEHLDHDVELLKVNKWKRLSSPWANRRVQELRAFCLEIVECLNKGVDCLVEQRNRYQKTADLCLSLMQNETRMNQHFQRKKVDPNDRSVIEFELYIQHLKEEASNLDKFMANLTQFTDELKYMTTKTANELKKRVAINSNIKHEGGKKKKLATSSRLEVPSPTEAIIAFGRCAENQILRNGKNKWEEWDSTDFGILTANVRVHKNIFIIGGCIGSDSTASNCSVYNIDTKKWSEGPKLNIARSGGAACFAAVNNHVYVIGGNDSRSEKLNSVERLNVTLQGWPVGGWQLVAPMKSQRQYCAAAVVHEKLFVSGGRTDSGFTSSMECLHLPTGEWSECRPMNVKRNGHAMIAFNDEILVFGGCSNYYNNLSSAEKYCPVNKTWERLASMRLARNHCGVALFNGKIYLVGGQFNDYGDNDDVVETIVEIYDPQSNAWSEGPRLKKGIDLASCVSW